MEKVNITLQKKTIELMRIIKSTHNYKTYDSLIVSAIKILSNSEITGEKSIGNILLENDAFIKKRVEQFFNRIGALEKSYFKKILELPDITIEAEKRIISKIDNLNIVPNIQKKESQLNSTQLNEATKNKYEKQIEELQNVIRNESQKLEILRKKFHKSTGFMKGSNYESSITESEYLNIFD